jgi:hypothetical protein
MVGVFRYPSLVSPLVTRHFSKNKPHQPAGLEGSQEQSATLPGLARGANGNDSGDQGLVGLHVVQSPWQHEVSIELTSAKTTGDLEIHVHRARRDGRVRCTHQSVQRGFVVVSTAHPDRVA